MNKMIRCFLAGIIQGSIRDDAVHNQDYRSEIKEILEQNLKAVDIYCPFENHKNSVHYSDEKAKIVFSNHLELVKNAHILIVFVPEASMGSAIEMWEAYHHKTVVITITQMDTNWVVRILSDHICLDIDDFRLWVESGYLKELMQKRLPDLSGLI